MTTATTVPSRVLQDALDRASLQHLMKALRESEKTLSASAPAVRVHVLRNHTLDNMRWFLEAAGHCAGLRVDYSQGGYSTAEQEVLDPENEVYARAPEAVILSLMLENLISGYDFSVEEVLARITRLIDALQARSAPLIFCNTFLLPADNVSGAAWSSLPGSLDHRVRELNGALIKLFQDRKNVFLLDWNHLEQRVGQAQSRSPRMWFMAKALLTDRFLKEYAVEVIKLLRAYKGKAKKCLVLDCDNTLWGGVVGEDGMDGIKLDPFDYPGNVFYAFQKNVVALVSRGVMIALCSKNNPEDVWEVLDRHPHCLLKKPHLSAWAVNWDNKAENVARLAAELNIGTDSMVFVDDSPMECESVSAALPEVEVLPVPKDIFHLPGLVLKDGLFDALAVSAEDAGRTEMMISEKKRKAESLQYQDVEAFQRSLELAATVGRATPKELPRAAQLTQKTNQFNLTTRRYSESELEDMVGREKADIVWMQVKDRFGDYGLVGLAVVRYAQDEAMIDTFLLSCRVLGRKAEDVLLSALLRMVWDKGIRRVGGEYIPTAKNAQTRDFYPSRGFSSEGEGKFRLELSARPEFPDIYREVVGPA
jgi:FkbH-like protein